jgi:RNA polymerase sigma-70 factor (ECF subfamily)
MEDNKIVELLFDRDEHALSEITQKYSRLYTGVLRETCKDESDVTECANDCLLAVWNSIPPHRPNNLGSYLCKIARRIGINKYRHNTRQKRGDGYTALLGELENCIPDDTYDLLAIPQGKIKKILEDFLRSLDAETRILFVRRYVYLESVSSLAQRFEMRENLVSVKLHRARVRLAKILKEEGYVI